MIDKFISDFVREYHVLLKNVIVIGGIIISFVVICGLIRFGIAANRRRKGIYPPSTSQMEHH